VTRYVIIGAGAVGATLAVELGDTGHDILLVAHGPTLEHLARQPLSYHTYAGSREIRLPVVSPDDDLGLGPDDILVLAVKTQDVHAILPSLAWRDVRSHRGETLGVAADLVPVVTVQNGLDAERSAARWFATVVGAVVTPSTGSFPPFAPPAWPTALPRYCLLSRQRRSSPSSAGDNLGSDSVHARYRVIEVQMG
jgi:2-dehydropantoate 2-reductase